MQSFRNLKVWEKAHQLTLKIYAATASFPREEAYGLTSQIRRAASSIGANIAEGCGRGSDADLKYRLHIAMGSATELDNSLLLARDLSMLSVDTHEELLADVTEVQKMLSSFIVRLRPGGPQCHVQPRIG